MSSQGLKQIWLDHKDLICKVSANFLYKAYLAQSDYEFNIRERKVLDNNFMFSEMKES